MNTNRLALLAISALALASTAAPSCAEQSASTCDELTTKETVLHLARSDDGLSFTSSKAVFAAQASSPSLATLPNGELLSVFDYAAGNGRTVLAYSISKDNGRSWSAAKLVKINGLPGSITSARHGHLMRLKDGKVRLYFSVVKKKRQQSGKPEVTTTVVHSAVTDDGTTFKLDRKTRIAIRDSSLAHATAAQIKGKVHLFTGGTFACKKDDSKGASKTIVSRHLSDDGRRFGKGESIPMPKVGFAGSIIEAKGGMRAYVSTLADARSKDGGVGSLVTRDGRQWQIESGLRMPGGWDPAVVRASDGTYLMLYCKAADAKTLKAAEALGQAGSSGTSTATSDEVNSDSTNDSTNTHGDSGIASANPENPTTSTGQNSHQGLVAPLEQEQLTLLDSLLSDEQLSEETELADANSNSADIASSPQTDGDGFASALPDFQNRKDYVGWWYQNMVGSPEDNAATAYCELMATPWDRPGEKKDWPSIMNMFDDSSFEGPPVPWDPADHPGWTVASDEAQALLEKFRNATMCEDYAYPAKEHYEAWVKKSDGAPILIDLVLPHLSKLRDLTKATLADGWRMEDGKVSPDRMMESWETCFRNAGHLGEGVTLIEELVSISQRRQVNDSARQALAQGVFSDDELEEAFETLVEFEPGNTDPTRAVRGEHAMMMDLLQNIFWPEEPGDEPSISTDHFPEWLGLGDEESQMLKDLSVDDVERSIDHLNEYYRELGEQMSVGYPEYRYSDIDELADGYVQDDPLAAMLLPGLSRVHHIRNRMEADARATQLAYATHIYKKDHGEWPARLEDIGSEYGYDMITDPFTGRNFGYRVTDDGPRIYSLFENGKDDGGSHIGSDADLDDASKPDDYVFWPPQ